MDERLGENKEITENIMIQLNELNRNLSHYLSQLEDNENKIVELEQFIQIVFDFSRKYGILPEFFESSFNEWEIRFQELADLFEENIYELKERELFENFTQSANQLSKLRIKNAEELSKKITGLLNDLSFKSAVFKAEVTQSNPYREGIDHVSFGIKTYEGANIAPISKVASGGELSRISLAIRVASAENSGVPVMIFDEVDVGIGGSVAEIVGNLLFKLGRFQQVFSITHLAQVAAKSNHHYKVVKQEFSDSVTSNIELLNAQDRVNEIARMVGGVDITEATLSYAKEMLAQ
jgi:DNA repair protein RecN (Recombination protein N)